MKLSKSHDLMRYQSSLQSLHSGHTHLSLLQRYQAHSHLKAFAVSVLSSWNVDTFALHMPASSLSGLILNVTSLERPLVSTNFTYPPVTPSHDSKAMITICISINLLIYLCSFMICLTPTEINISSSSIANIIDQGYMIHFYKQQKHKTNSLNFFYFFA